MVIIIMMTMISDGVWLSKQESCLRRCFTVAVFYGTGTQWVLVLSMALYGSETPSTVLSRLRDPPLYGNESWCCFNANLNLNPSLLLTVEDNHLFRLAVGMKMMVMMMMVIVTLVMIIFIRKPVSWGDARGTPTSSFWRTTTTTTTRTTATATTTTTTTTAPRQCYNVAKGEDTNTSCQNTDQGKVVSIECLKTNWISKSTTRQKIK